MVELILALASCALGAAGGWIGASMAARDELRDLDNAYANICAESTHHQSVASKWKRRFWQVADRNAEITEQMTELEQAIQRFTREADNVFRGIELLKEELDAEN